MLWQLLYYGQPGLRGAVAVEAAARSECYWLCNTSCRMDCYGTIDLGEMAIVQLAMVESVSPGDQKSTRKKLEALLQFLSAFLFGVSLRIEHELDYCVD